MNIFVVDEDPMIAARQLCDKHVVKMVTESAQMLSTAHRMLDGKMELRKSKSGKRMVKYYALDDHREDILYKAVHHNHPCTVWTMQSSENYKWHYKHYLGLASEYEYRYGKEHGAFHYDLRQELSYLPENLPTGNLTDFAIAMKHFPECIVEGDPVQSYRNYYNVAKASFAKWTNQQIPKWYHGEANVS